MMWRLAGYIGLIDQYFEDRKWAKQRSVAKPLAGHTLYQMQLSPNCKKVRKALLSLGLNVPAVEILLDDVAWQEMVKNAGKDQVPCMKIVTATGTRWMYESDDIVRYLSSQ